jgi:hypothetical protein
MKRFPGFLSARVNLFERRCLIRLIRKGEGSVTKAAKLAGRNRTEFYRLMKKHGLNNKEIWPVLPASAVGQTRLGRLIKRIEEESEAVIE